MSAPIDSVVVPGPDANHNASKRPAGSALKASSLVIGEYRKTNIQVCVRVRPILESDHVPSQTKRLQTSSSGGGGGPKSRSRIQPPTTSAAAKRGMIASKFGVLGGGGGGRPKSPRRSRLTESALRGHNDESSSANSGGVDTEDMSISTASSGGVTTRSVSPVPAWDVRGDDTIVQSPSSHPDATRKSTYNFDRVYGSQSRTKSIYSTDVRDVVMASLEGYHGTVFAYGQTSTGKTYTMMGTPEEPGVVPLAVRDCFHYIQNQNARGREEEREFLLRMSYMEIYNEQINDLLAPTVEAGRTSRRESTTIRIFESKSEGVIVRGLREEVVTNPDQVFEFIKSGNARRQVGSTNLNRHSSRSHSVFRLLIESRALGRGRRQTSGASAAMDNMSVDDSSVASSSIATSCLDLSGPVRVSSLSLVDLAGSESVKSSGATGARQKEGQYINKSLMTLAHVIYKLSESAAKAEAGEHPVVHIPYRDSKLTRLLQPSLSGNAQICIVCNISPLVQNLEESHNTLKFATRAKRIKQNAVMTEVMDDKTLLQNYREEIQGLKRQLKEAKEAQKALEEMKSSNGGMGYPETPSPSQTTTPLSPVSPASEDDTRVLVAAIENLEELILKNASSSGKGKGKGGGAESDKSKRKRRDGRSEKDLRTEKNDGDGSGGGADQEMREAAGVSGGGAAGPLSPTPNAPTTHGDRPSSASDDKLLTPARDSKTEEENGETDDPDGNLVHELNRIRGLLGTVLKRKARVRDTPETLVRNGGNNVGATTPQASRVPSTPATNGGGRMSPGFSGRARLSFRTPKAARDQEVEVLKEKLHEQEVEASLRKADSNFLQSQLVEKDKLLKEVSKILDAVEKRQVELEKDNASMKAKLLETEAALSKREYELENLNAKISEEDGLFSNLL